MLRQSSLRAGLLLAGVILICLSAALEFRRMDSPDRILPGEGTTRTRALKDYLARLEGSRSDTLVYFLA